MDLGEYQQKTAATDILNGDISLVLLGMAGEVGSLSAEYKKRQRDIAGYRAFKDEVAEDLGDLLWYAAALARRCGVDLNDVLEANLGKTTDRFLRPATPPGHALFDDDFDTSEQLPRRIDFTFEESIENDRGADPVSVVRIFRGPTTVGDPLDDNSDDNDGYRFHDVLHLGHMAVLGWSPTMRSLLKVKRRSDETINRIEDGGRSIVLEEGLTAYIFSVASDHSLFATSDRVPVDVIKACQRMTSHLEVSRRSSADWEYAILAGYAVFRELQGHRGGTVHVDLIERSLKFTPPSAVR